MKNIFSKIACIVVLLSLIIFSIFGCDNNDNDYYLGANWNVSKEVFVTEYYELYHTEIERVKEKCKFECSENVICSETSSGGKKIEIYLYTDIFTISLNFTCREKIAYYRGYLYYYGNDGNYGKYEDFKHLVYFLNDFTNYVAYDTKTEENYFEKLYYEAEQDEDLRKGASYYYHYDSAIGNVGYAVDLGQEAGYYYMAAFDEDLEKYCYEFSFEGLLKPLT